MKTYACFVLAVLAASPALAQDSDSPPTGTDQDSTAGRQVELRTLDMELLLNETVVTAGGIEQSRARAPANIVSWDRDEMRRHGWTTLADVLANTPGLYVSDDLVLPSVGVRGVGPGLRGGSRIMRIMINGIEVTFRPDLTAFLGLEYIPFDTIERIEIAKGPLSALYGANAFLATVNIITETPVNGLEGEVQASQRIIRNHGGFGFGGTVGYGNDDISAMVSYSQARLKRSGIELDQTFPAQSSGSTFFDGFFNDPSRNDTTSPKSFYGSFDWRNATAGNFKLQGGRQMLDSVAEFQPGSVLTHGSRIVLNNSYISLDYNKAFSDRFTLAANASYTHGAPGSDEHLVANGEPQFLYTRNFASSAFTLGASGTVTLPAHLSLKLGGDYLNDSEDVLYFSRTELETGVRTDLAQGDTDTTRTLSNWGVYAQLSGTPIEALPKLYVLAGGRVDNPNLFDAQFSWRGAVSYEWSSRFTTKLFVGRAFQTPSAVQLFGRSGFGIVYNTVGNQTLSSVGLEPIQPQKVFSTELASTYAITDTVVLDVSLYYQRVMDKIEFLPTTATVTANYTALNLSDQEFFGGEIGMRALGTRFVGYTTASAQMLTNRDQDGSMTFKVQPPREFPTATIYAGLTTRVPEAWFAFDVVGRVVGPRAATRSNTILNDQHIYSLPTYAAFDVTLTSLDLFLFGRGYETKLSVSVRNVFDSGFKYPTDGGFDIPNVGRVGYFQLAQAF